MQVTPSAPPAAGAHEHGPPDDLGRAGPGAVADRDDRLVDGLAHVLRVPVAPLRRDRRCLHQHPHRPPRPTYALHPRTSAAPSGARHRVQRRGPRGTGRLCGDALVTGIPVPVEHRRSRRGGQAEVGSLLSASTGTWTGSPASYAYLWRRCDASGLACVDVPDATSATYLVQAADLGSTLRARVVGGERRRPRRPRRLRPDRVVIVASSTPPASALTPPVVSGAPILGQMLTRRRHVVGRPHRLLDPLAAMRRDWGRPASTSAAPPRRRTSSPQRTSARACGPASPPPPGRSRASRTATPPPSSRTAPASHPDLRLHPPDDRRGSQVTTTLGVGDIDGDGTGRRRRRAARPRSAGSRAATRPAYQQIATGTVRPRRRDARRRPRRRRAHRRRHGREHGGGTRHRLVRPARPPVAGSGTS